MKKHIVLFIFLCSVCLSKSQICNSVIDTSRLVDYQHLIKNFRSNSRNYIGQRPVIRLALHQVNKSDSTGGFSWATIDNWVSLLPSAFAGSDICFTVVRKTTINNTTYHDIGFLDDSTPEWIQLLGTDMSTDAIDIYFINHKNIGGLGTGFIMGYQTTRPTITLGKSFRDPKNSNNEINIVGTQVITHEMGHCLGLFHTHQESFGIENIPRTGSSTNCSTTGDLLCETPADFNLKVNVDFVNDQTCAYVGSKTRDGFTYAPDPLNYMSYTFPTCMSHFFNEQISRMRNFILNTTNLDNFIIAQDRTVTGNITNAYYAVENTLTSTGIVTSSNPVLFEAGKSIVLNPGFEIVATSTRSFTAQIGTYACFTPNGNFAKKEWAESNKIFMENPTNILTVFPNPTNGFFTVSLGDITTTSTSIEITNLLGASVYKNSYNTTTGASNNITINSSQLPQGSYLVRIQNGASITTKQIAVVNN